MTGLLHYVEEDLARWLADAWDWEALEHWFAVWLEHWTAAQEGRDAVQI